MRAFSQKFISRTRLGSGSPAIRSGEDAAETAIGSTGYVWSQSGEAKLSSSSAGGIRRVVYSQVGYQAKDPFADKHLLVVDTDGARKHIFAALMTSEQRSLHAGQYLYRNLHKELLRQINTLQNIPQAFVAAIESLNSSFVNMHSFNKPLLENTTLVAAFVDLQTSMLYAASTGNSRCVVSTKGAAGRVAVLAQTGEAAQPLQPAVEPSNASSMVPTHITCVQLTQSVSSIILGSEGLWQELTPFNAALRMQQYYDLAPTATAGNAAAHLTQLALLTVCERTRRQHDPRMRALQTVAHLQSLLRGSRANYKWAGRQPLRRGRGDVHGDLSTIIIQLDWAGRSNSYTKLTGLANKLARRTGTAASPSAKPSPAAAHWDLLRMHFLDYARTKSEHTRQRWYDTVVAATAAHRLQDARGEQGPLEPAAAAGKVGSFSVQAKSVLLPTVADSHKLSRASSASMMVQAGLAPHQVAVIQSISVV